MPTTRDNKGQSASKKKPTQLDRIQNELAQLRTLCDNAFGSVILRVNEVEGRVDGLNSILRKIFDQQAQRFDLLAKGMAAMQDYLTKPSSEAEIALATAPKEEPIKVGDWATHRTSDWKGVLCRVVDVNERTVELEQGGNRARYPVGVIRKATPEEIATHERSEKAKKLVFGAIVDNMHNGKVWRAVLLGPLGPRGVHYYLGFPSGHADTAHIDSLTLVDQ